MCVYTHLSTTAANSCTELDVAPVPMTSRWTLKVALVVQEVALLTWYFIQSDTWFHEAQDHPRLKSGLCRFKRSPLPFGGLALYSTWHFVPLEIRRVLVYLQVSNNNIYRQNEMDVVAQPNLYGTCSILSFLPPNLG